jgi:hypothetical protein
MKTQRYFRNNETGEILSFSAEDVFNVHGTTYQGSHCIFGIDSDGEQQPVYDWILEGGTVYSDNGSNQLTLNEKVYESYTISGSGVIGDSMVFSSWEELMSYINNNWEFEFQSAIYFNNSNLVMKSLTNHDNPHDWDELDEDEAEKEHLYISNLDDQTCWMTEMDAWEKNNNTTEDWAIVDEDMYEKMRKWLSNRFDTTEKLGDYWCVDEEESHLHGDGKWHFNEKSKKYYFQVDADRGGDSDLEGIDFEEAAAWMRR